MRCCKVIQLPQRSRRPALESTIIGEFDTRRDAEFAVEPVQNCGVPRGDVFVQPGQALLRGPR
jgi:hypothetical protein